MKQQFLVRIEHQGRTNYHAAHSQRQALDLAHVYAVQPGTQQIDVLDATGRVVWRVLERLGS